MCLPGSLGQMYAEFKLDNPANVFPGTATFNEVLISVTLGTLDTGVSACYIACQYNWHWIAHRTYMVTSSVQSMIEIRPHPDTGLYFANCEEDYPMEPCTVLSNLYLNYGPEEPECLGTATESASWGAIKSMIE